MERDLSLALAETQAHLDLVASRFDILSDLGDLKEVKRLEADCRRTIRELAATGRVPADPLADLESELVQLCAWAEEVTSLRAEAEELLEDDQLLSAPSQKGKSKKKRASAKK